VNIFASITNHTMKTEEKAWRDLREYAASRLPTNFADRVLQAVHGPTPETWQQLQAHAAAQIRPGFAARVLRMARELPANVPSLFDQFALGAATMAFCLVTVFFLHTRSVHQEDERILASWQQFAAEVQEYNLAR
jgi:hypothetical protein